ncbi:hypothetical protein [Arthrobacter sp. PsM3]|uniref:hypothetical protein n=1 Tax=Arthrobacter sp. PsM3 TaxID=3030531 RepID=UPI00263A7CE0|nr:hypothetical protein [Arthrobacter sp. PsM3]MDN4644963.1 hypothetical protein [Arthrobacter sp. PsM3]
MNAYQAQRIRFGILAARHMLERDRLTSWQVDDLEGMRDVGWRYQDALEAFDREFESATERALDLKRRAALRAHGRKAAALRKKWLA